MTYSTQDVLRFEAPEEYCAYLRGMPSQYKWTQHDYDDGFAGMDYAQSLDCLTNGFDKHLARAEKLIEEMNTAQIFTQHLPVMQSAMVGGFPNVPAALNGYPKTMFRRVPSDYESTSTPLNVYVETLVSAGVSQDQLVKRGIAILGFILAMNMIRPIEVYTVTVAAPDGRGAYGAITKIASKPLDLKRATYMLTDPSYYRRLAFSAMRERAKNTTTWIAWPWGSAPTDDDYTTKMRKLCQCEEQDIFIKGGYLLDEKMLKKPIEWVKDMIKTHGNATVEI